VYLVRHGKAQAQAVGGDPARPLTPEGRSEIAAAALGLKALGASPTAVWHSGYVRARETAEIIASALGVATLVVDSALTPAASAERAIEVLSAANAHALLCVSHMPLLPSLVAALVGARVDFGTGTAAHISLEPMTTLRGLWSQSALSLIGRVR
ncbi:MAG TPA: phosphohistidine phosphatase SixA, partial [Myxococcota bacterium]